MSRVSPSAVVRQALGLKPEGVPLKQASSCCMCGQDIAVGALGNIMKFGAGFMDDLSLAKRGPLLHICGDCAVFTSTQGLIQSGFGAFGSDGVKPFRKWADIAQALLNPPAVPFVMTYATAKSQHMAWRSPVNYSQEVFRVRVGLRDVLIRREMLVKAPEICARVAQAAFGPVDAAKAKTLKTLPHPYVALSPDLKECLHGKLHPKVLQMAQAQPLVYPQLADDVRWLQQLTAGEVWALRFILTKPESAKGKS